jgi:hypothetical protein
MKFFEEHHPAIRSFGAVEKNVYFSLLNRQREPTNKAKGVTKKGN